MLTSKSPRCSDPTLRGTVTIPYGFTSPFGGTVVASGEGFGMNGAMNGELAA
ncbi:MAG: hypothetical protein JO372_20140 [Solirubrobacterales bacterium]|nr:hypothetical protein [Solirubrobacterales bacterium]